MRTETSFAPTLGYTCNLRRVEVEASALVMVCWNSCMRLSRLWIMVWCVLSASICSAPLIHSQVALGQADSKKQTYILDSVPEPRDEEIRQIRTAEDWHNPYVMVYRDSFELILHDRPRTSRRVTLVKLEKLLLGLSRERWPLGRVVAVQEIAIRSPGDDEKISRNVEALKRMLRTHKVRVDLRPTA